jgi:hypothetical protein
MRTQRKRNHLISTIPLCNFPRLDHPATAKDVAAGRAIFSMEGKGECKVWPLPEAPQRAKWITLKDYPTVQHGYSSQGPVTSKGFDQDGTISQAEDVLIDGKWRRYFGFVGRNRLATVPGAEIQFEVLFFQEFPGGWGFCIDPSVNGGGQDFMRRATVKVGQPLITKVWIQNLRGCERVFPKLAKAPATANAEDFGIEIDLAYCPSPISDILSFPPSPETKWKSLAAKVPIQVDLLSSPANMEALQKEILLQFDVVKSYGLKLPGSYRLKVKIKKGELFNSEVNLSDYFEIKE